MGFYFFIGISNAVMKPYAMKLKDGLPLLGNIGYIYILQVIKNYLYSIGYKITARG